MARKGDGTDDKIVATTAFSSPTSYSYQLRYKNAAAPGAAVVDTPLSFDAAADDLFGFNWDHTTAGFRQASYHKINATDFIAAKLTSTLVANTGYHIAVTWDGSNVRIYLNGVLEATTVAASIQTGSPLAVALAATQGTANYDDGEAAEIAYWHNQVLTIQEIKYLSNGGDPQELQRGSLKLYWKCCGTTVNEPDFSGQGNTGTVTGTTVVPHPLWDCRPWIYDTILSTDIEAISGIIQRLTLGTPGDMCDDANTGFSQQISLPGVEDTLTDRALSTLEDTINQRVLVSEPCTACLGIDGGSSTCVLTIDLARCDTWEVDTDVSICQVNILNGLPGQRPLITICNTSGQEISIRGWPTNMNGTISTLAPRRCWSQPFAVQTGGGLNAMGSSPGFDPRTEPGTGGSGGGGGGGACNCDPGEDHELTIECCTANCSVKCGTSSPAIQLEACGGNAGATTASYTWSVTGNAVLSATTGRVVTVTPPANPGSGVAGDAYQQRGNAISSGDCAAAGTLGWVNRGCNDAQVDAGGIGPDAARVCWSAPGGTCDGAGCPGYPCCGVTGGNAAIFYMQSHPGAGEIVDLRTAQMITDGCKPCAVTMNGAVVTVVDANGAAFTVELNA